MGQADLFEVPHRLQQVAPEALQELQMQGALFAQAPGQGALGGPGQHQDHQAGHLQRLVQGHDAGVVQLGQDLGLVAQALVL